MIATLVATVLQAQVIPDLSSLTGHPRLWLDEETFGKMRERVESGEDSYLLRLHGLTMHLADSAGLAKTPVKYTFDASGKRILQQSREAMTRIFADAYAYRFTGEDKYLQSAEKVLNDVCSFPSWNESHFLDVAEMAFAVAVGYDWLYGQLKSSTKEKILKAIDNYAFGPSTREDVNWFYESEGNWNQVCNAGLVVAALAVSESRDTTARRVIEDALKSNGRIMQKIYAPDGNYPEGPEYWSYGTLFEAAMISALESVLGSDFGLADTEGFVSSASYVLFCEGLTGQTYNYSDNRSEATPFYPLWYFAAHTGDSSLLYNESAKLSRGLSYLDTESVRMLPLLTVFASQLEESASELPRGHIFAGQGITPAVLVRGDWSGGPADRYLGFKGGTPNSSHAHMDGGSFVYEAYGTRWAMDIQRPEYETVEKPLKDRGSDFWDLSRESLRWKVFGMHNLQHNTLTVNGHSHDIKGRAELVESHDTPESRGGTMDLTSLFGGELREAVRSISLRYDDYLEVKDLLAAPDSAGAVIRWTMVTPASAEITSDGILLHSGGTTMLLEADDSVKWHIWPVETDEFIFPVATDGNITLVGWETYLEAGQEIEVTTTLKRFETAEEIAGRIFPIAAQRYSRMAASLTSGRMPRYAEKDGSLVTSDILWWCSGFFPGSLWLIYEYGGDETVRTIAEQQTLKLSRLTRLDTDHDIGFQMMCSYGNALRLTGDRRWLGLLFEGADKLAGRFDAHIGAIRSWDFVKEGRDWQYPVIIDNMMNLELLTKAADLFSHKEWEDIAITHARTTAANHFRGDYSSWHLVDFNVQTGTPRTHETVQGYADWSSWSRGQAWALYGYTMMYRETGLQEFLERAEGIAGMLLKRLEDNVIPLWDLDDPSEGALRDASAAAIMASAFAELSSLAENGMAYRTMATKQVRALASPPYLAGDEQAGFILKHSVGNIPDNTEVDVPLTYTDYYFLEALIRLNK